MSCLLVEPKRRGWNKCWDYELGTKMYVNFFMALYRPPSMLTSLPRRYTEHLRRMMVHLTRSDLLFYRIIGRSKIMSLRCQTTTVHFVSTDYGQA